MAFRWNKESLAVLRENAGVLTTEQIAGMLHTNITVVRNMAYRLKLSLRVSAYNQKRIEQVQTLYTSSEPLNLKEIAAKTGLTFSTVQYIVYVKLKVNHIPNGNTFPLKLMMRFIIGYNESSLILSVPFYTTSQITRAFINCI